MDEWNHIVEPVEEEFDDLVDDETLNDEPNMEELS